MVGHHFDEGSADRGKVDGRLRGGGRDPLEQPLDGRVQRRVRCLPFVHVTPHGLLAHLEIPACEGGAGYDASVCVIGTRV